MEIPTITEGSQTLHFKLQENPESPSIAGELIQIIEDQEDTIYQLKQGTFTAETVLSSQSNRSTKRLQERRLSASSEEALNGKYVTQLSSLVSRYNAVASSRDDYEERAIGYATPTPLKSDPKVPVAPQLSSPEYTDPIDKYSWNIVQAEIESKHLKKKEAFYHSLPEKVKDLQNQLTFLEKDCDLWKEKSIALNRQYVTQLSLLVFRYNRVAGSRDDYKERVLGYTIPASLKSCPKVPVASQDLEKKETFYRSLPAEVRDLQNQLTLLEKDRDFWKERSTTQSFY